jgi:hypothetical protein
MLATAGEVIEQLFEAFISWHTCTLKSRRRIASAEIRTKRMSIFLQHGMAGHKIGLAPQHIEASWRNVRFTPKSGHPSARVQRPLSQTRRIKSSQPVSITYCTAFAQFIMSPNNSAQRVNRWCVMTQYVVGLRHKTRSRALTN